MVNRKSVSGKILSHFLILIFFSVDSIEEEGGCNFFMLLVEFERMISQVSVHANHKPSADFKRLRK